MSKEKDARWEELEWLKLDLENRIHGMTICAHILSEEEKDYLLLFQRCLSVMERIQPSNKWIQFNEDDEATFPKPGKYILLSFSNLMIPAVGEYRQTEDGGGNFFLADSDDPLVKIGIFVNAWMPLPECYKEE